MVQAIVVEGIQWMATMEVVSQGQKVNITAECNRWGAQETMDHRVVELKIWEDMEEEDLDKAIQISIKTFLTEVE